MASDVLKYRISKPSYQSGGTNHKEKLLRLWPRQHADHEQATEPKPQVVQDDDCGAIERDRIWQ